MSLVTNSGRDILWSLRTIFMVAIGSIFVWTALNAPNADWLGTAAVACTGLMIYYVEAWAWWHRLRQRPHSKTNASQ